MRKEDIDQHPEIEGKEQIARSALLSSKIEEKGDDSSQRGNNGESEDKLKCIHRLVILPGEFGKCRKPDCLFNVMDYEYNRKCPKDPGN